MPATTPSRDLAEAIARHGNRAALDAFLLAHGWTKTGEGQAPEDAPETPVGANYEHRDVPASFVIVPGDVSTPEGVSIAVEAMLFAASFQQLPEASLIEWLDAYEPPAPEGDPEPQDPPADPPSDG